MSTRYKYLNLKEKRFLNKLKKNCILLDFDNEENNISAVEIEKNLKIKNLIYHMSL